MSTNTCNTCIKQSAYSHSWFCQVIVLEYRQKMYPRISNKLVCNSLMKLGLCGFPFYIQVLFGGRYQTSAGMTSGEELEQYHSKLSRAGCLTKLMSKSSTLFQFIFYMSSTSFQIQEICNMYVFVYVGEGGESWRGWIVGEFAIKH